MVRYVFLPTVFLVLISCKTRSFNKDSSASTTDKDNSTASTPYEGFCPRGKNPNVRWLKSQQDVEICIETAVKDGNFGDSQQIKPIKFTLRGQPGSRVLKETDKIRILFSNAMREAWSGNDPMKFEVHTYQYQIDLKPAKGPVTLQFEGELYENGVPCIAEGPKLNCSKGQWETGDRTVYSSYKNEALTKETVSQHLDVVISGQWQTDPISKANRFGITPILGKN